MNRKITCGLVALVCALAVGAGAARADDDDDERSRIVFSAENIGEASAACPGALFGLSFDMVSLRGEPLGTGRTCVHSFDGCSFAAGCHARMRTTFTLDFAQGSLTASVRLREVWSTDFSFVQRGKGRITAGTGEFTGARGWIKGGGTGAFTDQGLDADLVYVVHVAHGDDDD
jgi:hypothetical protein